jgi:hypothetical protein
MHMHSTSDITIVLLGCKITKGGLVSGHEIKVVGLAQKLVGQSCQSSYSNTMFILNLLEGFFFPLRKY